MKISCTPISAKGAFAKGEIKQEEYFELIAQAGADGTDIMDPNYYGWFWRDVEKEKRALKDAAAKRGLVIAAYATGNHFSIRDEEKFRHQVELVKTAIRDAAEMGTNVLRIFGGYHRDVATSSDMDYAEGLALVIKGIEQVLPEAQKYNVCLALENHGRLPGLSAEILYIMKQFDVPELGVCMDVANFYAHNMNETEDALHAYSVLKKYVKHVHYKDWKRAPLDAPKRVTPCVCGKGDGIVPLRQMAYLLEENNFAGFCSLEYEASSLDGVSESIAYMKSLKESAALLYGKKGNK
ncbi:MAG: sugar phosphate isomerase/epimerase [Lentisphaeria bacterium]|nr:sugar phosphate isomerase/epimerase [Lentisphaeria bacterium]